MLMANPHHAIKQRRKTSTAPVWFAPLFATDGGILTGSSVSLFSGCPLTSGDLLHAAQRNLSSSLPVYQIINESLILLHPSPVRVRDFGEGGISLRWCTAAGAAIKASHRWSGVTRGKHPRYPLKSGMGRDFGEGGIPLRGCTAAGAATGTSRGVPRKQPC